MTERHGFLQLCEMAKCQPDFATIHQLRSPADQVDWLRARIMRYQGGLQDVPSWKEMATAIYEYENRPAVAECEVGTIQL